MSNKVLFVDDDSNILSALRRQLHRSHHITTAEGPRQGLSELQDKGPFAVVISDMRMPDMSGIEFLREVQRYSPDTVRVMLTGNADLQTAIDAVNEGQIFRFLSKPCTIDAMIATINAAIEQYRLVTSEHELLAKTLTCSVKVLTDILALADPIAFGRASRTRRLIHQLAATVDPDQAWECEIAALLSQIGLVAIPPDLRQRMSKRESLSKDDQLAVESHPKTAHDLIHDIPRLEGVAQIILYQSKNFDGTGFPHDTTAGEAIPIGARLMRICLDFDAFVEQGNTKPQAFELLDRGDGTYAPNLLDTWRSIMHVDRKLQQKHFSVSQLPIGSTLAEDILSEEGTILVGKGLEVTDTLRLHLLSYQRSRRIREPIQVFVMSDESDERTNAPAVMAT